MTQGTSARSFSPPLPAKIILLIAVPLLLLLGLHLTAPGGILGRSGAPDLHRRAEGLNRLFQEQLLEARVFVSEALGAPDGSESAPIEKPWSERLEGVAVLDSDGRDLSWSGSPAESPPAFVTSDASPWLIRRDGVRTRLLVRSTPDAAGRMGVASFVIDSKLEDLPFKKLVPRGLLRDIHLEVDFLASGRTLPLRPVAQADDSAAPSHYTMLNAPDGSPLARMTLQEIPLRYAGDRARRKARAWAVVAFVFLGAVLFEWKRRPMTLLGLATSLGVLTLGRALLLLVRAPLRLLPRELGSASLYGSPEAMGLLGSPTDLFLTALALYFAYRAVAVFVREQTGGRRAILLPLSGIAVGSAVATCFWITRSLAQNASEPLILRTGFIHGNSFGLVNLGLLLTLLGAAELTAQWLTSLRDGKNNGKPAGRMVVALCLVLLIFPCSLVLQRSVERLELERISFELVPQVLEQSARRSVALSDSLRAVTRSFEDPAATGEWPDSESPFPAYTAWSASELFFGGYKSGLDFFSLDGDLISHFGFDLPKLDEVIPNRDANDEGVVVETEEYNPAPGLRQRLLHAEAPVFRDGQLLGYVVGHVVDEPDNLPFLPSSQPYLSALGAGSPQRSGDGFSGGPHYVLYNALGQVVVTSLREPPAETQEIRQASEDGGAIRVRSGAGTFEGLAVLDEEQVHLLLIRVRSTLERLAAAVRLALQALFVLVLTSLVPRLLRTSGLGTLVADLRGSFYRKLLSALLVASVVPLVGLALFLQEYIERRGEESLRDAAIQFVGSAQRQLEDYTTATDGARISDNILYWLRSVVGQEIHVYEDARLIASSKVELFASGLVSPRLDGEVQKRLVAGGLPYLVLPTALGPSVIPVAYAPLRTADPGSSVVVAVPLVLQQREIARDIQRALEMILLATVLLAVLLAAAAAYLARTVARPVHELVGLTARIAAGDYETRLVPHTEDELADLVHGFNFMASSLASQRTDLERRRDYMERLLLHATTGVVSTDAEGRIVTLNPAARELLGPVPDLDVGQVLADRLATSAELSEIATVLRSWDPRRDEPRDVDLERFGEPRRYRLVRVDLPDASGGGTLILLDDVTDLMRSNQLAAWAEMARAIAHEIKNPLTPIQLSTEHLRRLLSDRGVLPSKEIETCLDTVIKQVRELYQIAGEFSTYAKLPVLEPVPTDPADFMRETISPYRSSKPEGMTIEERYQRTGAVAIDRRVLARAVVNLVENALHAMPDGGRLTLEVRTDPGRDDVVIVVADTGTGLAPEVRRKLFDLYFSTKSSGTGLGLAIARRSVQAHHGRIEVESEPGRGTVFRIYLPLIRPS